VIAMNFVRFISNTLYVVLSVPLQSKERACLCVSGLSI
jgi:hypothetical protein